MVQVITHIVDIRVYMSSLALFLLSIYSLKPKGGVKNKPTKVSSTECLNSTGKEVINHGKRAYTFM